MTPRHDAPTIAALSDEVDPRLAERDPYRSERVRGQLTFALCGLFVLTIAFVAAQLARGYWEQTREFAEIILPAEIALLGSAIGFYFTTSRA